MTWLLIYSSRCWIFCGGIDIWALPHHCCSILKASWRSYETVFGNFPLMRLAHTPVYNNHAHWVPLWVFFLQPGFTAMGKVPFCGQPFATDPSIVSLVSLAVIFLPPIMEPIHLYIVSLSPCHLAAFVMSHEMLSETPSISRKSQV